MMNHELNLTTFRYEKSDMEAIELINWILITFKLKDKLNWTKRNYEFPNWEPK